MVYLRKLISGLIIIIKDLQIPENEQSSLNRYNRKGVQNFTLQIKKT